ncbi:MAG: hypothetical protein ACREUA_02085, partial [Burkholderiales bacterium]
MARLTATLLNLLVAVVCFWVMPANTQQIGLTIGDLKGSALEIGNLRAQLSLSKATNSLELQLGEIKVQGVAWRRVRISCGEFKLDKQIIDCARGTLYAGEQVTPLKLRYAGADGKLHVQLLPARNQTWDLSARFADGGVQTDITVNNGDMVILEPWLPPGMPRPSRGLLNGRVTLLSRPGYANVEAQFALSALDFSDAAGLRAGQNVSATLSLVGRRNSSAWDWQAGMGWDGGEVYWQPLYFAKAGHHIAARGRYDRGALTLERARLQLAGMGVLQVSGIWDLSRKRLKDLDLNGRELALGDLFTLLIRPFLEHTLLGETRAVGNGDIGLKMRDGKWAEFQLALQNATLEDDKGRYALHGVDLNLPWARDKPVQASISIKNGALLHVPFGPLTTEARLHGGELSLAKLALPVLDGVLNVDGLKAELRDGAWRWEFSAGLIPLSMDKLTSAMGLTPMHGTLSGVIPRVSYGEHHLRVDGALLFKLFDGTAVVTNLEMRDPLGRASRLKAELAMRNIDLDLLT